MKRKVFATRLAGIFLLLIAGAGALTWFVWLAPLRHISSWAWLQNHTPNQTWMELQRELKYRGGYAHISGSFLGMWGHKESAAWIINEFKAGRTHGDCIDGHLDMALPDITNQELGDDTNAWIAWWSANSQKTQEEWIRDGFAKRGLELPRQLTTNNIIALLKIIGSTNAPTKDSKMNFSRAYRYNAFRWLRDAGIAPKEVDYQALPTEDRAVVIRGLISYANDSGTFANHPGRIFKDDGDWGHDEWWLDARLNWVLGAVLALLAFFGWRLLRKRSLQ